MAITRTQLENHWQIYALVSASGADAFSIKIGVSSNSHKRYSELLVGIPYESTMLSAEVGYREQAYKLEAKLHKHFKSKRLRGEWFLFTLNEKQYFHDVVKQYYLALTHRTLEWVKIKPESAKAYMSERRRGWKGIDFGKAAVNKAG